MKLISNSRNVLHSKQYNLKFIVIKFHGVIFHSMIFNLSWIQNKETFVLKLPKMGSFVGHLIPGAALTLMGIWWAYNIFYKYHVARKASIISDQRRGRYKSTLLFPNNSCCKGAPIEAIFIIAASFTGIIGEWIFFSNSTWHNGFV